MACSGAMPATCYPTASPVYLERSAGCPLAERSVWSRRWYSASLISSLANRSARIRSGSGRSCRPSPGHLSAGRRNSVTIAQMTSPQKAITEKLRDRHQVLPVGGRRPALPVGEGPRDPDWFREDFLALLELLHADKIHPVVAERLPLADARRAHELLEQSASVGKLVLVP
jgi:hypothetical protein